MWQPGLGQKSRNRLDHIIAYTQFCFRARFQLLATVQKIRVNINVSRNTIFTSSSVKTKATKCYVIFRINSLVSLVYKEMRFQIRGNRC